MLISDQLFSLSAPSLSGSSSKITSCLYKHLFILILLSCVSPLSIYAGDKSEKAAAKILRAKLANEDPEVLKVIQKVSSKEIVVVRGSMDHIEDILSTGGIKYTLINPNQVARADLNADQVLMVNCPGNIPANGVTRIEQFVRAGGLLYTTDWSLKNLIEKGFPKTIKHNGRSTGDHVTPVNIVSIHDNMMSNILLREGDQPQWWLESGSYPITILDPKKVQVLAQSKEMGKKYHASPVVVRFPWHDGEVIHVVSHFYRQINTKGSTVSTKAALKDVKGLNAQQKATLANGEAGEVKYADVASSYAFQRMTTNLINKKQKQKKKLDKKYQHTPKKSMKVGKRVVKKGDRVKVLWKKNGKAKVRDDRGNEAVISFEDLDLR